MNRKTKSTQTAPFKPGDWVIGTTDSMTEVRTERLRHVKEVGTYVDGTQYLVFKDDTSARHASKLYRPAHSKANITGARCIKKGDIIYIQGDGRQYITLDPVWVTPAPEERYEDLSREGWIP